MSKEIPFEKSFASSDKAKYWSDKNELKPAQVALQSNKKFWFNCSCGHEFDINLGNINQGNWCSYCSNPPKKLCDKIDCKQCFEKSFASSDKTIYWSSKNELKSRQVFKISARKYYFNCNCGHELIMCLSTINLGRWCCYCCNPSQKLCDKEDCNQCFEKSFASSDKAIYWSSKNELKPRQVFKKTDTEKYWFECKICNHNFKMNTLAIYNNKKCNYCENKYLCDEESCKICFEKSFASSDKAIYWSYLKKLIPKNIGLNVKYVIIILCPQHIQLVEEIFVFIVVIINYVIKKIVSNVLKNHLLVVIKQYFGLIKIN